MDQVILHVAPISDQLVGGPAYSVTALLKALSDQGAAVALLTTHPECKYTKSQPYPVFYYRDLAHYSLRSLQPPFNQPDLICFHSTYIPVHAWLARQARHAGIPYIITPRGGMNQGAQNRKRWKKFLGNWLFFSWMVRGASAIHCLTQREAEETKRWGRPVFVVGNGIDLPPEEWLAQPGNGSKLRFLFLGRLDIEHKGLDLLLEGFALVRDVLIQADAELAIYGPSVGTSEDVLHRMIEQYELAQIVSIKGQVLGEDKVLAFSSADVFILPSRYEGHPVAVLEALSYGLPCLLTPATNMAAEVSRSGAGWEVPPSPSAIADGVRTVIGQRRDLAARGLAARQLAQRYSWSNVAEQLLREYGSIIG